MKKLQEFVQKLEEYKPYNSQEEVDKKAMLEVLNQFGKNIFDRSSSLMHMTSSAIVLNEEKNKVLFAYHLIYNSYAWLGGHADGEIDLFKVAIKEVKEETGLKNIYYDSDNIASIEILPVFAHMKRGQLVPNHLHLNVTYLFTASEKEDVVIKPDENSSIKWIPIEELDKYVKEKDMMKIYKKIISKALKYKTEFH